MYENTGITKMISKYQYTKVALKQVIESYKITKSNAARERENSYLYSEYVFMKYWTYWFVQLRSLVWDLKKITIWEMISDSMWDSWFSKCHDSY